jgi:hypothetical protein
MNNVRLDYNYLDHERLQIEDDVVFKVKVLIGGPVLLHTADDSHREQIVCDVFVQAKECRSSEPNDLLRCAVRRVKELSAQAHALASQETL